jgi:hypothetical protein
VRNAPVPPDSPLVRAAVRAKHRDTISWLVRGSATTLALSGLLRYLLPSARGQSGRLDPSTPAGGSTVGAVFFVIPGAGKVLGFALEIVPGRSSWAPRSPA